MNSSLRQFLSTFLICLQVVDPAFLLGSPTLLSLRSRFTTPQSARMQDQALIERLTMAFSRFPGFLQPGSKRMLDIYTNSPSTGKMYVHAGFVMVTDTFNSRGLPDIHGLHIGPILPSKGSRGFSNLPDIVYAEPIREILQDENQFATRGFRDQQWTTDLPLQVDMEGDSRVRWGELALTGDEESRLQKAIAQLGPTLREIGHEGDTVFVVMNDLDKKVKANAVRLRKAKDKDVVFGSHFGLSRHHYYIDVQRLRGPEKDLVDHLKHEIEEQAILIDGLIREGLITDRKNVPRRNDRNAIFMKTIERIGKKAHAQASTKGDPAASKRLAAKRPLTPEKRFGLRSVVQLLSIVRSRQSTMAEKIQGVKELAVIVALEGRTWNDALTALRVVRIMSEFWGLDLISRFIEMSVDKVERIAASRPQRNVLLKMPANETLQPVDVFRILRREVDSFRQRDVSSAAGAEHDDLLIVRFSEDISNSLPRGYAVGEEQLTKLIRTILSNARDAVAATKTNLHDNSANIKVSAKVTAAKSKQILIAFQDHGTGIEPSILLNMFTRFFSTKGGAEGGRGNGLDDARITLNDHRRGIMEVLHNPTGLRVRIESKVGEGTTFKLYLGVVRESRQTAGTHSLWERSS